MNPVLIALDKEIARFKNSVENRITEKAISPFANRLSALWNSYEGRIKEDVYGEKILELGDFLFSLKCYRLASNHCYGRYLYSKCGNFLDTCVTTGDNILLETFFPDINNDFDVVKTIRALIGYSSSACLSLIYDDVMFQNAETPNDVAKLLRLMQLSMQIGLKKDSYCWLVYNGTVQLYSICRVLMTRGFSSTILKYLLWACVCMESSVPLMTVKYFSWRSQFYTLTCQCYFDLKADEEAEKFAHRGLQKLEELKEIERISSSAATPESTFMFSQATIKLNTMVFKFHVFESKRRARGTLRAKIKPVLKDIVHTQWPRTSTERLLAETFRSRSAQFLAVIESLTNSNRRLVQTTLGAPENDDCLDAYLELFFAGVELLAGGGGTKPPVPGKHDLPISDTIHGIPLLNLAASESQAISLTSAIRFVKLSYNYENWETFDLLISPLIEELKKYPEDNMYDMELKFLSLISIMVAINPSKIRKKMVINIKDELDMAQASSKYKPEHIESLLLAATMLNDFLKDKNSKQFITLYHDALIDIVFIFWNKCRKYFARITSSLFEGIKYQDRLFLSWLKVLIITQKLMITLNLNDIDVCACAEASLKLSVILECIVNQGNITKETDIIVSGRVSGSISQNESIKSCKTVDENIHDSQVTGYFKDICAFLGISGRHVNLLNYICEMLNLTLNSISSARDSMLKSNAQISDQSFVSSGKSDTPDMYTLNMQAYHLEITHQYYHIIALLKSRILCERGNIHVKKKGVELKKYMQKPSEDQNQRHEITVTGKNDLLKALFILSSVEVDEQINMKENTKQLEEAYAYIQKSTQVESKIRHDNIIQKESFQTVPPPPLLIRRGSSWMVLKPAPFKPKGGEKIRWYCLFLRNAAGNNVKVRLNDTKYMGTGEEVPYHDNCIFTVKGLEPNERYLAAVAAYDDKGCLIGGNIGESSRPFLAAHVLPCLLAYAKLCRIAFLKNVWKISKMSFKIIWDHFVEDDIEDITNIKSAKEVYKLHPYKLIDDNVANSSLVMLRHFIECIFINVDVAIKEGSLFCDALCDKGPLSNGQLFRLNECEKLLIAIAVCGWLNDNMLCLQAIVMTYGLLAPIIHWKQPVIAALQVLLHIHCGLQEIQAVFKNKKQNSTTESLRHMICCLSYYVAKVLVHFNKNLEAIEVLETSSKLIMQMNPPESFNKTKAHASLPDDDNFSLSGKKAKKAKPRMKNRAGMLKSLSEILPGNLLEIRALEIYTLKLLRETMIDSNNELTGNEDIVVMKAVVSSLPIPLAYKEVVKFKRKAQFFEAFVGILGRAVNEGSYESVLEWAKETVSWLTKRNEIILNKTTNDQKGVVVVASNVDGEKLKRYSTAVVEYGRTSVSSFLGKVEGDTKKSDLHGSGSTQGSVYGGNKNLPDMQAGSKQLLMPISEGSEAGFSNTTTQKGTKTHRNNDDKKTIITEEKKNKEAAVRLNGLLTELWKTMQRRRKMRNVCFEELPWRCQMNLISAEGHFQMCLASFDNIAKQYGCPDLKKEDSMMDVSWFTLSTSGVMIVSWLGCMKTIEKNIEPVVDIGGTTIDHKPQVHIVPSVSKQTISVKVEKKHSHLGKHSSHRTEEQRKEEVLKKFLHHVEQVYLHYQRAIVLSHRGRNWVLLQQSCNKLLHTTHRLMVKIMLLNTNIDINMYEIPYNLSKLRTIIYNPFYLAAEFLLECMSDISEQWIPESEVEVYGNIRKNKGGCCLMYDYLDCNSYIDYSNIKRVIMFAIEVLFYEQKWERIIDVIMKFNAISIGHFSESLLPLLVISQRHLLGRLTENDSELKFHPSIIFDPNTGVPLDIDIIPVPPEPIEPGAHIDPIGHNLYDIPVSGSKYSIVPFEYDSTLTKFKNLVEGRSLVSRTLEHSRKLFLAYLAGKQGKRSVQGRIQRGDSAVSFAATQVKPPTVVPVDYKDKYFELIEDIEIHPLSDKLLSVVIASYENTIETLKDNKEIDLVAQAMHELGNIMFHCKNIKASFKWWSYALDTILQITNTLKSWRTLLDLGKNTLKSYKPLLDKYGVWGCMLVGLIATKIARYIYFADIGLCRETCHLAAVFFSALFSASLVHPTSYYSYVDYNIGINHDVTQIVPGLNLFSDDHRIHCNNLTDTSLWLSKQLIKFGFYLEVQPLLTFTQYLSSNICEDISITVEVKLLRIESLCYLNIFGGAIKYFCQILLGNDVPNLSDSMKVKLSSKLLKFNDSLPLTHSFNVGVINEFCRVTLKDIHYSVYGQSLCNMIIYTHANVIVSLAKVIYEIPIIVENFKTEHTSEEKLITEIPKAKLSRAQKVGLDEKTDEEVCKLPPKSNQTQNANASNLIGDCHVDKTSNGSDCPRRFKGKLLQHAEFLIKDISQSISPAYEVEAYVRNQILLSKIAHEKLLTITAAHHMYLCLQAISEIKNNNGYVSEVKIDVEVSSDDFDKKKLYDNLDIHIWLLCRYLFCFYLSNKDTIVEKLGHQYFLDTIGSIEDNINDALTDCEMFNDQQTMFLFQMMLIDIDVKNGKDAVDVLACLKNLEDEILPIQEKSYHTKSLHFDLKRLAADLKALSEADPKKSIKDYEKVEMMILDDLCFHGYDIDMDRLFPIPEQMNVNSVLLDDLICIKVCRLRSAALSSAMFSEKSINDWKAILVEIDRVFYIMEKITSKLPLLKIELLFVKGEIQRKLVESNHCHISTCVKTLLEVVDLSNKFTCDLSIIRQCYLEIAMILFSNLKIKEEEFNKGKTGDIINAPLPYESQPKTKRRTSVAVKNSRKLPVSEKISSKEINRLGKCIWICIRASSIIAKAQQKTELLAGEVSMTTEFISEQNKKDLLPFALEDILGMTTPEQIRYHDTLCDDNTSDKSFGVTWSTLLNYIIHLYRSCSYSSLVIGGNKILPVRTPRKCHMRALKLNEICRYLESNCAAYQDNCMCALPMESISSILKLTHSAVRSETAMEEIRTFSSSSQFSATELSGSISAPAHIPSHVDGTQESTSGKESPKMLSPSPSLTKPGPKSINLLNPEKAKEFEIAVQWYLPELDDPSGNKIDLLVALNNKNVVAKSPSAQFSQMTHVRHFNVNVEDVFALHENMVNLMEEEAVLELQVDLINPTPSSSPTISKSAGRRAKPPASPFRQVSKAASPSKMNLKSGGSLLNTERDDENKKRLSTVAAMLSRLLIENSDDRDDDLVDVPFDATWNNIDSLAGWMNPSFGHITRTSEALFTWMMDVFGISSN